MGTSQRRYFGMLLFKNYDLWIGPDFRLRYFQYSIPMEVNNNKGQTNKMPKKISDKETDDAVLEEFACIADKECEAKQSKLASVAYRAS